MDIRPGFHFFSFMMIELIRTDASQADFLELVAALDLDLAIRDGDDHGFFAPFNKIDSIRHVVLAYVEGAAVGCGAIKPYAEDVAEVKRMYTLPQFRGRGVASQVLAELEAWASVLGFSHCMLETGEKQPEAIGLYRKCGYAIIPNYGQYIGVVGSVCFKKQLIST